MKINYSFVISNQCNKDEIKKVNCYYIIDNRAISHHVQDNDLLNNKDNNN